MIASSTRAPTMASMMGRRLTESSVGVASVDVLFAAIQNMQWIRFRLLFSFSCFFSFSLNVCYTLRSMRHLSLISFVCAYFSSRPQRPMTFDFEGFSIPDCIHYIYFPYLNSLVWRGPWLGIEPGTSRTRSQHSTTRLSRGRFMSAVVSFSMFLGIVFFFSVYLLFSFSFTN